MTLKTKSYTLKAIEGFTLIEMMVVIAVIGILSAAVLAGLGPSRTKAKDARIISGVQQARAIIETLYDPITGGYPADTGGAPEGFRKIENDVKSQNGNTAFTYHGGGSFALSAKLASGNFYCVSSTGDVTNGEAQQNGTCSGTSGSVVSCTGNATQACGTDFTGNQTCVNGSWNRSGCAAIVAAKKGAGETCTIASECISGTCSNNALGILVCQ